MKVFKIFSLLIFSYYAALNCEDIKSDLNQDVLVDTLLESSGFEINNLNRYLFKIVLEKSLNKNSTAFSGQTENIGSNDLLQILLKQNLKEKKEEKRFFKKRYLVALLGLLAFLGINITIAFKLFDLNKQNLKEIDSLRDCLKDKEKLSEKEKEKMTQLLQQKLSDLEKEIQKDKESFTLQTQKMVAEKDGLSGKTGILEKEINVSIISVKKDLESLNKDFAVLKEGLNVAGKEGKAQMDKAEKLGQETQKLSKEISDIEQKLKDFSEQSAKKASSERKKICELMEKHVADTERKIKNLYEISEKMAKEQAEYSGKLQNISAGVQKSVDVINKSLEEQLKSDSAVKNEGFWSSLLSFNVEDFTKGVEFLERVAMASDKIEKVTTKLSGNSSADDDLEKRLERLKRDLPSVPRNDSFKFSARV